MKNKYDAKFTQRKDEKTCEIFLKQWMVKVLLFDIPRDLKKQVK